MCGGSCWHWMAFAGACWCLLVPDGVFLVSYGVWRWEEGVWGFTQSVYECCLWTWLRFGSLWGSIWVFRPCMMQQMLYIGKSPKGKIPHTWHFWNIKIPKPPYVSSLKIIGLLHLFIFLGSSKEIYNLQSLWITLYSNHSLARGPWDGTASLSLFSKGGLPNLKLRIFYRIE